MCTIFKIFIEFVSVLLLKYIYIYNLAQRRMRSWLLTWGLKLHPLYWKVKS